MAYLHYFKHNNKIGFKDFANKVVIPPIYDCFKIQAGYILAGRDGFYPSGMTMYTGVYDMYTRYGDMILGDINKFEETESHFLINLGGEWLKKCKSS